MKTNINFTAIIIAVIFAITILGYGYLNNSPDKNTEDTKKIELNIDKLGLGEDKQNSSEGKIGQWASLAGLSVLVREAAWGEFKGNRYYLLVNEENTGSAELMCSPPMLEWKLIDKNGVAHKPLYSLKDKAFDTMTLYSNLLKPGDKTNGYVFFDIPATVIPDYLIIEPCITSTKTDKTIKIVLSY